MNERKTDLPIQVEPNEPQGPVVPSAGAREDEQLPDSVLVGRPQSSDQPDRDTEDAHLWGQSLAPEAVKQQEIANGNTRLDFLTLNAAKEEVDIPAIRDLLFSIRDQGTYCAWCRCPEWSQSEMRSSHYEGCVLGLMCEKLLRLYPKDTMNIKWRK